MFKNRGILIDIIDSKNFFYDPITTLTNMQFAEGAGINSQKEFTDFLGIALGSTCKLEIQFIIANKLKHITDTELSETILLMEEIQKTVSGLRKIVSKRCRPNYSILTT